MGVINKIAGKVAGEAASKVVDKAGDVANNAIELEKDKVNKELNIEKEKTKQMSLQHDIEMEKLEAEKHKEFVVDYSKASTSIDYLCEAIFEIEQERNTYKYKNAKYSNNASNPVNRKITSLISHFQIPNDRDEFIRTAEIMVDAAKDQNTIVAAAWKKKLDSFGEKAQRTYPKDKEVKQVLRDYIKMNPKTKKIVLFSVLGTVGVLLIAGISVLVSIAAAEEKRIPEPGPGQTIYIEHDHSYFTDKNYLEVQTYFSSKGFENITLNPLGDLITGWVTKEGSVKEVSINGDTNFPKKQWYVGDEAIVISYHSF